MSSLLRWARETGFLKLAPLGLLLAVGCTAPEKEAPQLEASERAVVYGEDDRLDVYAHPDAAWRTLARQSIAVMAFNSDIDARDPNDIIIEGDTLGVAWQLCSGERFSSHPTGGQCSGTLVDNDLILTAGHCIDSSNCSGRSFLFDYYYEADGQLANISADDLYACDEVVAHALGGGLDYALVRLDRPVVGDRRPVPVSDQAQALAEGSNVTLIGFPTGIPLKIAENGRIVDNRSGTLDYFEATVDAFGGNSGSGVFDSTGTLVGILVRGATDYVADGNCYRVNVLSGDSGSGEDITYGFRAREALCDSDPNSAPVLCGGGGGSYCFSCSAQDECADGFACVGGTCTTACANDGGCPQTHECLQGICRPQITLTCAGQDVTQVDGCGQTLGVTETCGDVEECRNGACVERGAGEICGTAIELEMVDGLTYTDTLLGATNDYQGSCAGNGPEHVFRFSVPSAGLFSATSTGFDTTLYLRGACDADNSEIVCNDDETPPGDLGSYIEAELEAGEYFLFMDAYGDTVGEYTLTFGLEVQCQDACALGARQCQDKHVDLECVAGPEGCAVWSPVDCGRGICASGYGCIPRPEGDRCLEATPIPIEDASYFGDLGMYTATMGGTCGGLTNDRFYTFELEEARTIAVEAKGMDTVVYIISDCARPRQTEHGCNDDATPPGAGGSYLEATLEAGQYTLVVDSNSIETVGDYQLDVAFFEACLPEPCDVDATRCQGGGVETCVARGEACTYWAAPIPCDAGLVCEGGACGCADACPLEGETLCEGNAVLSCEADPQTGCLDWSAPAACDAPMVCEGGACACVEICEAGARECVDETHFRACAETGACLSWGEPQQCEPGTRCEGGACVPTCEPECEVGAARCVDGAAQRCELIDECPAWGAVEPCASGCIEGACVIVQEDAGVIEDAGVDPDAAVEEDAQVIDPDAAVEEDAQVIDPDAAVEEDAQVIDPDAAVEEDAQVVDPDAVVEEDAQVVDPDAAVEEDAQVIDPDAAVEEDAQVIDPDADVEEDAELVEPDAYTPTPTPDAYVPTPNPDAGIPETPMDPDGGESEASNGQASDGCSVALGAAAPQTPAILLLMASLFALIRRRRG